MANLSPDDGEIIEKNPLNSSLDDLQESLRDADDNSLDHMHADNQKVVISRLLRKTELYTKDMLIIVSMNDVSWIKKAQ